MLQMKVIKCLSIREQAYLGQAGKVQLICVTLCAGSREVAVPVEQ